MNNEEFQKKILEKLDENDKVQKTVLQELKTLRTDVNEIKAEQKSMSTRQDEIYQVVRAIEHSNVVGRSELDSQNIRLAIVEGKLKKVANASNL